MWSGRFIRRFMWKLVERAQKMVLGNPLEEATEIGPVIRPVGCGADLQLGGGGAGSGREAGARRRADGFMVEPTVLTGTKPGMKVHDEEIFGPVVWLSRMTILKRRWRW
jgi:acyl-CoA reductase-like NAD-dependent aldehyde dehydrogenase